MKKLTLITIGLIASTILFGQKTESYNIDKQQQVFRTKNEIIVLDSIQYWRNWFGEWVPGYRYTYNQWILQNFIYIQ